MSGYKNLSYDDRDTDKGLTYRGDWTLTGSYNATHVGDTGTLASTNDLAANVTFRFPVDAIAFYYYGIPRSRGGRYGICIDCYPDKPNYMDINAFNESDDGGNPPVVLFSWHFKTPGRHEIIIRNENDTRGIPIGNSQLTLDRIELEVVDGTSTTTSNSDFKPTASSSASGSHHTSILGGALGGGLGFVVVLTVLFLFWFCQRRRRKASATSTGPLPSVEPFAYASSLPPPIVAPATVVAQNFTTLPTTNAQYPGRYGYTLQPRKEAQDNVLLPSTSAPLASPSSQSSSPPNSNQPRREQDAGYLPADTEGSTLPPDYNQVFSHTIRSSNIPSR